MTETPEGLKPFNRSEFFFPGIEKQKKVYVTVSEIVGTVALWAIQQSPYAVPDNLESVCKQLHERLRSLEIVKRSAIATEYDVMFIVEFGDLSAVRCLEKILKATLREIPEYLAWNERKNGNQAPLSFTSRYDKPGKDPDDGFIDLGALERNVAMTVVQDYIMQSRDGWVMTDDGLVQVENRSGLRVQHLPVNPTEIVELTPEQERHAQFMGGVGDEVWD